MIEQILYFLLGFLSSGLLALMVGPAIWARAVRLTRRRIEASQPLTLAEIKADRDQLRADFAVTSRRLELNISDLRTKFANQRIEVTRAEKEIEAARAEGRRLSEELSLRSAELRASQDGSRQLAADIQTLQAHVDQRNALINGLELRISELNSEIDVQKVEVAALGAQLAARSAQSESLVEARRVAEERVNNLKLEVERRGGIIAEERDRAERLLAELTKLRRLNRGLSQSGSDSRIGADDNERPAISRLEAENAALELRLRALADERDRLAYDLQSSKVRDLASPPDANDIAALKGTLGDLAARMTAMAADREAAGRAMTPENDKAIHESSKRLESLADKIQALRDAASSPEQV